MKLLNTPFVDTGRDLSGGGYVALEIEDGAIEFDTALTVSSVLIGVNLISIVSGNTYTIKFMLGGTGALVEADIKTILADGETTLVVTSLQLLAGTTIGRDFVGVEVKSDRTGGTDTGVVSKIFIVEDNGWDANNRVDVSKVGGAAPLSADDIADGVWDESNSDHVADNTKGRQVHKAATGRYH